MTLKRPTFWSLFLMNLIEQKRPVYQCNLTPGCSGFFHHIEAYDSALMSALLCYKEDEDLKKFDEKTSCEKAHTVLRSKPVLYFWMLEFYFLFVCVIYIYTVYIYKWSLHYWGSFYTYRKFWTMYFDFIQDFRLEMFRNEGFHVLHFLFLIMTCCFYLQVLVSCLW